MTKGLVSFKHIKQNYIKKKNSYKLSLIEKTYFNNIEKELEALKLINSKNVNISILKESKSINYYNFFKSSFRGEEKLEKEEFILLKEVFK